MSTVVEESRITLNALNKLDARFVPEAPLYFKGGAQDIDPKRGLWAYGPSDAIEGDPQTIRVGIVSTAKGIEDVMRWGNRCNTDPIESSPDQPFVTQSFPGFVKTFNCRLVFASDFNESITDKEVRNIVSEKNPNRRIRKAAELYAAKVGVACRRVVVPDVVICHESSEVEAKCGAGMSAYERTAGLSQHDRKAAKEILENVSTHRILAPLDTDTQDLIEMTVNQDFRAILKARCLEYEAPTQILTQSALEAMLTRLVSVEQNKAVRRRSQDASTIAWNLAVALYYKANHFPWRVGYLQPGTIYIGISFYFDKTTTRKDMFASLAQIFMDTGQGMVVRGDSFKWDTEKQGEPHLMKDSAFHLLDEAIRIYKDHHHNQAPNRIVIHKSSRYFSAESAGFEDASKEVPRYDFVTLSEGHDIFFYRNGENAVLRGTVIPLGGMSCLVYTKGYTPYLKAYHGPRVPRPLEITEHRGDTPVEELAREIVALTRLNWNSADYACNLPVTLQFSERVGYVLGRVKQGSKIQHQYRFYM